jgi:hypothetical protein
MGVIKIIFKIPFLLTTPPIRSHKSEIFNTNTKL